MGRFTDPHFLRRAKSRKSPKRPALPGAVIWVWAVHRPTPFNLLLFFTSPGALILGFFQPCLCGAEFGFLGLGAGRSPLWGENRLTGPHRPEKPGAFPQEKTGAAHPRVSLRPSHRLGLAHRAKQAGPGFVLLGAKKPLPGFVGQRPGGCLIHLFSKNVPQRPHKRKAMRSVSWSVTRRKTGFPRMQAPT